MTRDEFKCALYRTRTRQELADLLHKDAIDRQRNIWLTDLFAVLLIVLAAIGFGVICVAVLPH